MVQTYMVMVTESLTQIGQAAHRTPWTVAMRQIPVKGSTDSIFALAQESSILQNRNMKN